MKANDHVLYLIPWHIGNSYDITLSAVRCVRRLRCFLAEDPKLSRRQFAPLLGENLADKEFLFVPEEPDSKLLRTVLDLLKKEDVGMVASGGAPCFIDPGAWLVRALRERGAAITALGGASCLSTMLSLSGIEWHKGAAAFSFIFFPDGASADLRRARFMKVAERDDEALVVLLGVRSFRACIEMLAPVAKDRAVSVFFDLTKCPSSKYPYADRVQTMNCDSWRRESERIRWEEVSDVSLIVHPRS